MSYRTGLIVLQGIGALSLIPYPAILVASIMSLAAEGQTLRGALPYVLAALYPLVWIALDKMAWVAMSRDATGWAVGLSSVPVVLSVIGALFAFVNLRGGQKKGGDRIANPLAWTLMCYYGPPRYDGTTPMCIDDVLREISVSGSINDPVPDHGTPLGIAVWNLKLEWTWNGTPADERQKDSLRIVRALVDRGARLSAEEESSLNTRCRLRLAVLQGRNTTDVENPLVWVILKGGLSARDPFVLSKDEIGLLNKPTKLYGTPLQATLLLPNSGFLAMRLIEAGARLSAEEGRDAAITRELEHFVFERYPRARELYGR